jgi:membrane protein YqaA with SNARE-associated domain
MLELWGMFVSAFISSTIAPGGSEAVLAYMVTNQVQPIVWLISVATVGNTLGALTTWWLGYLAAKKYPAESVLDKNKQRALNWIKHWGNWSLLFSWLPVVGDALCFAGGWLKLPLFFSISLIFIGKLFRYLMIAYWFV